MAPVRKKICNYSEEAMKAAVKAVQNGMGKKTAAKRFNVPRSTIADKISGRYREKGRELDKILTSLRMKNLKLSGEYI